MNSQTRSTPPALDHWLLKRFAFYLASATPVGAFALGALGIEVFGEDAMGMALYCALIWAWLVTGAVSLYYGHLLWRALRLRYHAICMLAGLLLATFFAWRQCGYEAAITSGLGLAAVAGFALTWAESAARFLQLRGVAGRISLAILGLLLPFSVALAPVLFYWYQIEDPAEGRAWEPLTAMLACALIWAASLAISILARRAARKLITA